MPIRNSLGFQQITVSTTAIGITAPKGQRALISTETSNVRWRDDGTDPTASVGFLLETGTVLGFDGNLAAIKFIKVSGSDATVNVALYD